MLMAASPPTKTPPLDTFGFGESQTKPHIIVGNPNHRYERANDYHQDSQRHSTSVQKLRPAASSFRQLKAFLWHPIVECVRLAGTFRYLNLVDPSVIAKLRRNHVTPVF